MALSTILAAVHTLVDAQQVTDHHGQLGLFGHLALDGSRGGLTELDFKLATAMEKAAALRTKS